MRFFFVLSAALLSLLSSITFAYTQSAHVHGVASIQVAIDAKAINITFSSPLDNLVGFEHAPQDNTQRKAIEDAVKILNSPEKLFSFTASAKCKVSSIKISSPAIESKSNKPANDSHMELEAEYLFNCENASAKDLYVNLFTHFTSIKQINYQMIGPRGQFAKQLSPADKHVAW